MGGINVKNTMIEAVLRNIAPHPCFGCGKIGTVLCANCKNNITTEPYLGCLLCGKVSQEAVCVEHEVPICKAWIVSERVTVLKRVVDAYKFEYVKGAAHSLVDLLDESLPLLPPNTIIVPVPTTSSHIRQRGFDHLDLLARLLSIRRGLPVVRVIERSSAKTQHRLNKSERKHEASGAFHIAQGVNFDTSASILILDDIITTGSTVSSVSRTLADAGAKTIFVAALAYQPLD